MSLINEALKRAKQAQQENPATPPPLEFRSEEPGQISPRRTTLLIVGITLLVVMILGMAGMLIWFVAQSNSALPVVARVADAPLAAAASAPEITPANVPPVSAPLPFERPEPLNTNSAPAMAEVVAEIQPPALKLQGIFFNPSRPSVVVNGKTIYLGDRVSGFRLIAVSPVAATFVSATETNVLSLSGQ
jgi:hypothetical protein